MSESAPIDFYGASWCGDCVRAQALLEHYGVAFEYHDIEASDSDKAKAIELSGRPNIPRPRVLGWNRIDRTKQPAVERKTDCFGTDLT